MAAVSDDPSISDIEAQKDDVRERVRQAGAYAQAVYAADKISKVRELRLMMDRGVGGDAVAIKRERYRKSLAMLEDEIPESELVEILRLELRDAAAGSAGRGHLALERRRLAPAPARDGRVLGNVRARLRVVHREARPPLQVRQERRAELRVLGEAGVVGGQAHQRNEPERAVRS